MSESAGLIELNILILADVLAEVEIPLQRYAAS